MRKKIALLLAFSMIISILPTNVFANANISPLPFNGNTGAMVEQQLGPATNVRHMEDGSVIGRENVVNSFFGLAPGVRGWGDPFEARNLVRVPGGNLRHVIASGDYFAGRNFITPGGYATIPLPVANIVMDISNARGWLTSAAPATWNIPGVLGVFGQGPAPMAQFASLEAFAQVAGVATPPAIGANNFNSLGGRTASAWAADLADDLVGVITLPNPLPGVPTSTQAPTLGVGLNGALLTPAETDAIINEFWNTTWWWDAGASAFVTNTNDGSALINSALQNLLGSAVVSATNPTPIYSINHLLSVISPSGETSAISADLFAALLDAFIAVVTINGPTDVANTPLDASGTANVTTIRNGITNGTTTPFRAGTTDWVNYFLARAERNRIVAEATVTIQASLINADGTFRRVLFADSWNPTTAPGTFFAVVVVAVSNTRANMLMIRSSDFNDAFLAAPNNFGVPFVPWFQVPIEYITNGDSNSDPIFLTFQEQAGWPQAGQSNRRTDLTTVSDSRFTISTNGDVRNFHRYGRAILPRIRIAEAVQEAFDQAAWWVDIELITPGFYFTEASTGLVFRNNDTRYNNLTVGNDIRPVAFPWQTGTASGDDARANAAIRTPNTGNNRFNTISFPVFLNGWNNLNRHVNDWFQVGGMSVGATDRARTGPVEAEVSLFRAAQGAVTDVTGHWSWHIFRRAPGGDWEAHADLVGVAGAPAWLVNGPAPEQYPTGTPQQNNGQTVIAFPVGGAAQVVTVGTDDFRGEFRWNQMSATAGTWGRDGDALETQVITVAHFGEIGLELVLHENDSLEDFDLRSGMRQWEFIRTPSAGESRPIGTVLPIESELGPHTTARAILRELSPGSLPATGAHPTTFSFNEGIQILGVRFWTNEAHFSAGEDDVDDRWEGSVFFGDQTFEADNFLNATLGRNTVTIRPEIGAGEEDRRWRVAEITAEFYVSIIPGYEHLYGQDLDVSVTSGTVEAPFEDSLTIAYVWDPIMVDTQNISIDENNIEAAFGVVRGISISDITITETRAGELYPGQRLWVGLEGGISRGWGSADHQALRATTVETTGTLRVSPIQHDSHGIFVEVLNPSREDGEQIIFRGVEVSGRVIPDHQYNIMVADTGVAHNWEGWGWITNQASDVGFTRGMVRGFFNEEPYVTPAFTFEGADFFAPPTNLPGPAPTPGPGATPTPPVTFPPQTLGEWMTGFNSIRVPGRVFEGPPIILVPNLENPAFQTSYVMFAVVADLLGITGEWEPVESTGTFSNGTTTVVVTNGQTTAMVNGTPREIRTARSAANPNGLLADARIINDRFYVPITFFRDVVPEFPVTLQWNDAPAGQRSVTVFPR